MKDAGQGYTEKQVRAILAGTIGSGVIGVLASVALLVAVSLFIEVSIWKCAAIAIINGLLLALAFFIAILLRAK